MTTFVRAETLTPEQLVAIRISTRYRLQSFDAFTTAPLVIRPLLASDFLESGARLEVSNLPAKTWRHVSTNVPGRRVIAVMGFVAYAARPAIDQVRFEASDHLLPETFTLAEINAASRMVIDPAGYVGDDLLPITERFVDLRRIGYFDPAYVVGPNEALAVSVQSQYGLDRESFDLIGLVAEPSA